MKNKRTVEFGLGLAGAIWSLVSIVFAIIATVFAFGVSNSLVSNSYYYYSDYYTTSGDIASAKFILGITAIIVVIVILLALVGGILSLVGAISVRNKTTAEKVTKEGVFMLVGGIINGNLLSLSAGIVALARHSKPEEVTKSEGTTEATTSINVEPLEK